MWDLFTSAEFEKRESEQPKEPPQEEPAPEAVPDLFEPRPGAKKPRARRGGGLNEARTEDV
ncbi:MAG TPA: hypothetical protein VFS20_08215, partial [Longimicrobium sp.]|nr:hypothetical protein [Longimicrobium sp.]